MRTRRHALTAFMQKELRHVLRDLLERHDATVSRVLRVGLGALKLERTLARGSVRQLSAGEIAQLLERAPPQADEAELG